MSDTKVKGMDALYHRINHGHGRPGGSHMNLRVLRSDSQRRWKEGQPSWDLTQHKKKKSRDESAPEGRETVSKPSGGKLYNAKGDLVMPVSSLEIDI